MKVSSKVTKIIVGIAVGVLALFLLLCALLVGFLYLVFFGGPPTKTRNIEKYSIIYEKDVESRLAIFPEQIAEQAVDVEFDFFYQDTWAHPTSSIFLQVDYTDEDYAEEVERLENIKKMYNGEEIGLMRDEKGTYPYPAYIAIENHHHVYEYALLSGENQITYIHTAYFDKHEMRFDTKYLPSDFRYGAPEGEDQFYYGYNYYINAINANGIAGISYDY